LRADAALSNGADYFVVLCPPPEGSGAGGGAEPLATALRLLTASKHAELEALIASLWV
jgi:hypothetical protein